MRNHLDINNQIKQIQSIGKNRIRIIFKDSKSANIVLNSEFLKQNNLNAYIPKFLKYRLGVIKRIEADLSESFLKDRIMAYDFHNKFEVDFVKRINKKIKKENIIELEPTTTIIVSFRCQTLPKYVEINKVLYEVETYTQKVLLCYNCFRYGHLGRQCRNKERCMKCGENHKTDECKSPEKKCLICKGDHYVNDFKQCPEYTRQKEIKNYMANSNSSYNDANKAIPRKTYASVASSYHTHQTQPTTTNSNPTYPTHYSFRTQHLDHQEVQVHTTPSQTRYTHKKPHSPQPFTQLPKKRTRVTGQDNSTIEAHRAIVSPITLPQNVGRVLNSPFY